MIGIVIIVVAHKQIRRDQKPALIACFAAAVGTTMRGLAALPIATSVRRPIAAVIWACASPSIHIDLCRRQGKDTLS